MEKQVVVNRNSCRICLVQNGTISINDNLDGKLIVDHIQDFGNITVERFASIPNSICNECNCLLKQAIKLKSNIINADIVINGIFLQSDVVVKNKKVTPDKSTTTVYNNLKKKNSTPMSSKSKIIKRILLNEKKSKGLKVYLKRLPLNPIIISDINKLNTNTKKNNNNSIIQTPPQVNRNDRKSLIINKIIDQEKKNLGIKVRLCPIESNIVNSSNKQNNLINKTPTGVLSKKKTKINIKKNIEHFSKKKINKIEKMTPNSKNNNNKQSDLIINVQKDDTMKIKLNDIFVESFLNQKQSECIDNISNDQLTLAIGDDNINLLQNNDTSLQMELSQLNHINDLSVEEETQFDDFTNDYIDPIAFLQVDIKTINTFCFICNQIFQKKGELKIHNTTVHPELKKKRKKCFVQCPICLISVSKQSFKTHERKHQPQVLFKCQLCEKQFRREIYLNFHMNVHNDIKFQCEFCEHFYSSEQGLKTHFNTVHSTEKHFCEFCTKHFTNKISLKKHFLISHADEKKFECKKCQVDYVTKEGLCDHQKKNHTDPKFCNTCNKLFLKPFLLIKHMQTTPICNIEQKQQVIVNTTTVEMQTQNVKDKEDATRVPVPIIDENGKSLINVNTQEQIILIEE